MMNFKMFKRVSPCKVQALVVRGKGGRHTGQLPGY